MRARLRTLQVMAVDLRRHGGAPWREGSHTGQFLYDTQPLDPAAIQGMLEELTRASRRGRRITVTNGHLSYERKPPVGAWSQSMIADGAPTAFLRDLMRGDRTLWRGMQRDLARAGVPVGTVSSYSGPGGLSPAAALAAVTGGTANVVWWTPLLYTPLPAANGLKPPSSWRMTAGGLITSTAASQTITPNANVGTAAGTGLAVGAALTLGSTITNAFWRLAFDLTARTTTTAGTAVGNGLFHWGTTAGATATVSNALFGGGNTVQTVDFVTAQQALAFGATPSAAGVSVTPTIIHWTNWD